jgi:hypothetical protein
MADSLKGDMNKALKHPRSRPWLAVAAELPATLAAHHFWGNSAVAGAGLTVAAGVLTATAWWAGQGTTAARRVHATLSTGAGTAYLVVGTITDPLDPALLSTLVIGGAVAAGGWNIRQALRVNVDQAKTDASESGVLVKSIGKARAALRGTPKVEPNKVTAPLQLSGGDLTTDELGNRVKHIAGELGVSPTAIRFIPDPERADHTTLVIVPEDQLKGGAVYPGPSLLGGSITDPIPVGIYEDGAAAVLWFPSDPVTRRNATHFLLAGMNGSGKSVGMTVAITEALTRRDVIVWAADPSKGQQTFGPLLPYFDWAEMTMAGGEAMVAALTQVITARADALGRAGFKNWTPEAYEQLGMPYMVVWFEEAAKFFREGTEMEGLVMEARSAGISVIISLQRPSASSMPTDVREQLGGVMCFGVKGATTADMALPDDVRDAGARPEAWENRKPGYAYLVAPGVDEERYPMPIRTYLIDDDAVAAALAIAPRPSADPITAAAAGEAYANRTRYDAEAAAITETQEAPMPETPEQAKAREEAALGAQVEREITAALGDDPDDDGYAPDVDADREIPPAADVWSFGQAPAATAPRSTEDALAELLALLDQYREEDRETVGPKDFGPFGKGSRIGRSRAWVSERLGDLADEGVHLAETNEPGVYQLLYPEMATA